MRDCGLICSKYTECINQRRRVIQVRKDYDKDADRSLKDSDIHMAADLQKVNMLPRIEQFKDATLPDVHASSMKLLPV